MKLYDGGRAPNPRRTRIFLAEKGIKLPIEQVDLGAMQHRSAAYTAVNPLQRVPALVLGRGALDIARVEMWQRRVEQHFLAPVSHVFRNSHPAMKEMEVPQVPAWAE